MPICTLYTSTSLPGTWRRWLNKDKDIRDTVEYGRKDAKFFDDISDSLPDVRLKSYTTPACRISLRFKGLDLFTVHASRQSSDLIISRTSQLSLCRPCGRCSRGLVGFFVFLFQQILKVGSSLIGLFVCRLCCTCTRHGHEQVGHS